MVMVHSPWPLFCPDLRLAQQWLLSAWQTQDTISWDLAMLGPSLGLLEESAALLQQTPTKLTPPVDRHLAFRLARGAGRDNAYGLLVPEAMHQEDQTFLHHVVADGSLLGVDLRGGIGDHLELLSLLLPWTRRQKLRLRLLVTPERQHQLGRLLSSWPTVQLASPDDPGMAVVFQAMNIRAVMGTLARAPFEPWIARSPTPAPSRLVCCWQATGRDVPHSAWSRSVPFVLVEPFYRRLIAAGRPATTIVDLSLWKPWQAAALSILGIQCHNPTQGDLLDLVALIGGAEVITIDTALAHLCAAMGQRARVLLPRFPDERWIELHRPQHSYGQVLQLHRQTAYGDWSSVLETLPIN